MWTGVAGIVTYLWPTRAYIQNHCSLYKGSYTTDACNAALTHYVWVVAVWLIGLILIFIVRVRNRRVAKQRQASNKLSSGGQKGPVDPHMYAKCKGCGAHVRHVKDRRDLPANAIRNFPRGGISCPTCKKKFPVKMIGETWHDQPHPGGAAAFAKLDAGKAAAVHAAKTPAAPPSPPSQWSG